MENLQKPMSAENNQQVNNNEQEENTQDTDVSLQQDNGSKSEADIQAEEPVQCEEKEQVDVEEETVIKDTDGNDLQQNKDDENVVVDQVEEVHTDIEKTEPENKQGLAEEKERNSSDESSEQKELISDSEDESSEEESEGIEIADDFFDHLNRQEIVETLEEIVGEKDIVKIKKQVSLLKIRFLQLNKEEKEERLQSFLADGGNKEDYDYSADELETRFNEAFDRYRANKAKYTEDLEQTKVVNLEKKQALLEELKQLIESSTDSLKQIYDRFKEIQTTWKEIGPVPQGNVAELWQNYHFYVEKFFDKVKINRELRDLDLKKNLERKLEICEKTEALLLEPSIVRSFKLLQQYHQEWKESGPVEDDKKEELWNRFKTASDKINQNRKDYYEQLDNQQEENYKAKLELCDKLEGLMNTEFTSVKQVNEMSDEVTELFNAWKSLGPAPKEVHDEVWDRFRKALDSFFANKKQYLSKFKEEQVDNYNLKLNLCIQAEAVALRKDWKKATTDILALQQEWKEIGSVSRRQSEALWKRFRKACDDFFAAKSEYFSDVHKHEADNLQMKEDLIKRVNEYVFVDSREDNFEALKAFQREWTSIGYTAVSEKERLWNAFRSAIDKRFDELKSSANEMDRTKYAERIHGMLDKDARQGGALVKEQRFLQNKIKQLTDDVNLWENNLGFFAHSKNSNELREQFNKKIEQAKQEIESLKAKLEIIKESKESGDKK